MLKIENIEKNYGKKKAVDNITLYVNSGEIVGLLGPNGAGKTTTFYIIAGIINADSGKVLLDQEEITKFPIHMRAKKGIAYLSQEQSIFRHLTVEDNIKLVLEENNYSRDEIETITNQLLKEFQIENLRNQRASLLSGGEKRRLEIARTLSLSPRFILLDEPFAGVDPILVADIQNMIIKLKEKGIGIIITDHNVREALRICDRAYVISNGKILSQGTPDEIAKDELVIKSYLGERYVI
ncbi:MAG: LPS export ABC transporter ATP-binding protein [Proteobacteria bacterium]|nr:LPS export ABC transporter ATP-binding protein [Pseudomonadota bacterium]